VASVADRAGDLQQQAKQDVLGELNARVYEAAKRFDDAEPGRDLWGFTCECGAPDCRAPVSLTLADYQALRKADRPVLAPGHDRSDRPDRSPATA
jgi:hypothetical protein